MKKKPNLHGMLHGEPVRRYRGGQIRTDDLLVPNQAHYQAVLHPGGEFRYESPYPPSSGPSCKRICRRGCLEFRPLVRGEAEKSACFAEEVFVLIWVISFWNCIATNSRAGILSPTGELESIPPPPSTAPRGRLLSMTAERDFAVQERFRCPQRAQDRAGML